MNRNTEAHFTEIPNINIKRSSFDRGNKYLTTMNTGDLICNYLEEVYPGDTVTMKQSSLVRMNTPVFPVADNAYLDQYFFYVPSRLVWEHFKELHGENNTTYWEQPTEYEIPQIEAPAGGWAKGTIADYMGIPTGVENISVSALPFRCYAKIWNDWFRSEAVDDPCLINLDDTTITGSNGTTYESDVQKGGMPAKVNRFSDYFSSALPQPQKGAPVMMPLGNVAPVVPSETDVIESGTIPVHVKKLGQTTEIATDANVTTHRDSSTGKSVLGYTGTASGTYHGGLVPVNLVADLTAATGATISALRMSMSVQAQYERDARLGTRYNEIVKQFGVTSPDARLQRSEYLGGARTPINVDSIVQSSETGTTPQGNVAGYSCTIDHNKMFTKSFTEHGYLIGVCCIRTNRTYQQGIRRFWSRKKRFDFYYPAFAGISEQAILNKEILAQGTAADEEAFGYQEPWADLKFGYNMVTGAMRSAYAQSLDAWHYADDYETLPTLSSGWMKEGTSNVDRTIAVSAELEDQFNADFYFDCRWVRPIPLYCIPGMATIL